MRHREELSVLTSLPDHEIPLDRAALTFAIEEYPALDVRAYLDRLDAMGAELATEIELEAGPREALRELSAFLFDRLGFRGAFEDDEDPRNSYLNEVLDRRVGISISLSLVYLAVGRRLGLDVQGVGLPGHFLVKHEHPDGTIFVDPYNGGALLTREECFRVAAGALGRPVPERDSLLAAVTPRQLLTRMLYNLKAAYLKRGDLRRALGMSELVLAIFPWDLDEIRDRGVLHHRLGDNVAARRDLDLYLRYRADAPDAAAVRRTLEAIRPRNE